MKNTSRIERFNDHEVLEFNSQHMHEVSTHAIIETILLYTRSNR